MAEQSAWDKTKKNTGETWEETKKASSQFLDDSAEVGSKAWQATKDGASATSEAISNTHDKISK